LKDYPIKLLKSMLETPSPSGSEAQLAKLLGEHMGSNGLTVRFDRAGNVIGKLGHSGPRILLCGHMDTVPGEFPVHHDGGFLYGRGAVDAKSSLAAMLVGAVEARKRTEIPFSVALACVVEEERSSAGIKALMDEGAQYDCAVFGEPSGASNITVGYKGSLLLELIFRTEGGHSASPWLSRNGFEEASEFWRTLRQSLVNNDSTSKFEAVTGCVTRATAGEASNMIPTKATMEIDLRVPPTMQASQLLQDIEALAKEYESTHSRVNIESRLKDCTDGFVGPIDSFVVRAFRWAIRRVTGEPVTLVKKTGTSDANLFAEKYTIPMIVYGPGDSSLDHTNNERISIREYLNSIEVYANAIPRLASLMQTSVAHAEIQ